MDRLTVNRLTSYDVSISYISNRGLASGNNTEVCDRGHNCVTNKVDIERARPRFDARGEPAT